MRYLLGALVVVGLWFGWDDWQQREIKHPSGVLADAEPRQVSLIGAAPIRQGQFTLTPRAQFSATAFIYPALHGTTATTYVAMTFGSLTVAAFFMTLVGRSFAILAACQLGALIAVSVFDDAVRSWPLAALAVVFVITTLRGSREFRKTASRAIRLQLQAEQAIC